MQAKNIINIEQIEFTDFGDGGKFAASLGRISPHLGARNLSYNITVIPPGKRAFAYHRHHAIEEMFFILEGKGTLRYRNEEFPIAEGDFIACPPGPGGGHQVINSGTVVLKFLAVSTNSSPDIVEYPDSGKIGAMAGDFAAPDKGMEVRLIVKKDAQVDYYEGESD